MRSAPLALALLLAAAMTHAPAAAARECVGTAVAIGVGADTLYIDDSGYEGGQRHQTVYLESNGEPELQRGGPGTVSGDTFPWLLIGFCTDSTNPDARLYP